MTEHKIAPCRLRPPEEDGAVLVAPSAKRLPELIGDNLRLGQQRAYDLQGRAIADVSLQARSELIDAAWRWTAAYRDVPAIRPDAAERIFLAGHQPQMFHPGVWMKNFALGALARVYGATAINIIVDGDTVSETSLTVPSGTIAEPLTIQIEFDRAEPKIPYEERVLEDRGLFASFGVRVAEAIGPLVREPFIGRYWPRVLERAKTTNRLGTCLAQARHQAESEFFQGLETLEVPESWLCEGEAFQWFAAHVLAQLPRFQRVYNAAIREYREVHHLRSRSHPAPELAEDEDWHESPFWVWTAESPTRRRLFARAAGRQVALSDRVGWETSLPLTDEADAGRAVEGLIELARKGVRIRPRALMTTLWARLALGDLFVHGIGGAKYDWVTDRLIELFFHLPPPSFLVVSATLHLPIDHIGASAEDVRAVEDDLRDMTYHPERYLRETRDAFAVDGAARSLIETKWQWIKTPQTPTNARRRCQAIRRANVALQPWLEDRRRVLNARRDEALQRLRGHQILSRRDYAFCLYPEQALRHAFSSMRSGLGAT